MTAARRDPLLRTYWEEILRCQERMQQYAEKRLRKWGVPISTQADSAVVSWLRLHSHELLDWSAELAEGRFPEQWREWGVKQPGEKQRQRLLNELSYASLVASLGTEVAAAMGASYGRDQTAESLTRVVGVLAQVLGLLSEIDPRHVLQGIDQLRHLEKVQPSCPGPGIQAAVDSVYQTGFTEEATWQALVKLAEEDNEFVVEDRHYSVRVDRIGDVVAEVYQVEHSDTSSDDGASGERPLKRGSFNPYFQRARAAAAED